MMGQKWDNKSCGNFPSMGLGVKGGCVCVWGGGSGGSMSHQSRLLLKSESSEYFEPSKCFIEPRSLNDIFFISAMKRLTNN